MQCAIAYSGRGVAETQQRLCGLDEVVANTLQQQANPSYEYWMARANVNSAMGQQWGATEALSCSEVWGVPLQINYTGYRMCPKKGAPFFAMATVGLGLSPERAPLALRGGKWGCSQCDPLIVRRCLPHVFCVFGV